MKHKAKNWRSVVTMCGIIVGLAIAPLPRAFAFDPDQDVFPPDKGVFGMTYGDWSAAWWQYVLAIPTGTNPVLDPTGAQCDVGQSSGPVFFLAGAGTSDLVTRTCTVPASKAIFFPIINIECSTVEAAPFHGDNEQGLRQCVGSLADDISISTLKVTVDGVNMPNLKRFRVQSPLFDFIMPKADNFLGLPRVTSGSSVSDGYWLMLKPLSPGEHVIHFEGAFVSGPPGVAGFSQNVKYQLTVQ